jgi:hypothetical protein
MLDSKRTFSLVLHGRIDRSTWRPISSMLRFCLTQLRSGEKSHLFWFVWTCALCPGGRGVVCLQELE